MKLKKITAVFMAAVMAAAMLTACGNENAEADNAAPVEETSAAATLPEMSPMRDIPSIELVKEMSVGWNLGNTFDSSKENFKGDETVESWETAWGQPVTTKAMIDSVKAQGFNDCVVYLNDSTANIVVKSEGLEAAQAAQIKDILLTEVTIPAENIRIFEVK